LKIGSLFKIQVDKLGKKGKTDTNEVKQKQSKPKESKAEASKSILPVEETLYSLQREKRLLLSKLKNEKKELSEIKSDLKNLEFQLL
jgi:predicted RNase H-like nuclease (RuvC/YqgF family)